MLSERKEHKSYQNFTPFLTKAARAWLESADAFCLKRQKQLILIVNNCNIKVTLNKDILYAVTNA